MALAGTYTTRTGAYGASGVVRATLAPQSVAIADAVGLTHQGRHRVKARVYGSGTGPIYARAAYRIGSGPWSRGKWTQVSILSAFSEIDLGIVCGNSTGTLTVRVEAYSTTPGDTLDIDYLLIIPTAKYAKAKGPAITTITPAPTFTAVDNFNQTAGNLSGKTAGTGGNWTTSGSITDLAVVAGSSHNVQRSTTADTQPRYAELLSAASPLGVSVDVTLPNLNTADLWGGVMARVVSTGSSYLGAHLTGAGKLVVYEMITGSPTVVASYNVGRSTATRQLQLQTVDAGWAVALDGAVLGYGTRPQLGSGQAIGSGKVGFYDYNNSGAAGTRVFDNFYAWTPEVQNVTTASGAVIIDHDSIARSDGTRPRSFEGNYLTCPPAGREGRVHRLVVKMRRYDVDTAVDDQIADRQRVDVTVTPRVSLL